MDETEARDIVVRFNDCISRRDIEGLAKLMTREHVFIDAANNTVSGKERCLETWSGFFAAFPDYRNVCSSVLHCKAMRPGSRAIHSAPIAALRGLLYGQTKLDGALIAEWRVYDDTSANRAKLRLSD